MATGSGLAVLLAGWIADAQGSYAMAYQVASLLLAAATVLALLSYVGISVDVEGREVTFRLSGGRRATAAEEAGPGAKAG